MKHVPEPDWCTKSMYTPMCTISINTPHTANLPNNTEIPLAAAKLTFVIVIIIVIGTSIICRCCFTGWLLALNYVIVV